MNLITNGHEARPRERLAALGASLFARGLTTGTSGNLSVRVSDGWLMTPTNASLGTLDPDRLSKLDENGRHVGGDRPTKESLLHLVLYRQRRDAGGVVHLHSTYAVAVSCMDGLDPAECVPPLTAYFAMRVGRLPLVPYHRPGDPALATAMYGLAARYHAILLANHGPIVSDTTLDSAAAAIEELEETAKLFLLLRGIPTRPLSDQEVSQLDGGR
ncbi:MULTISPECIES: 3-oxo-tetronate 4-phosphate decarboxylase [unclassified Streptomyces]|uniref:3-oxo-tetronate 4-phosphate decarboxylase n=1 Tax=unclassified Streptomyces TaxID=2593676 RepID=UPI00168AE218|nr:MULTISPECIES: 3-oxo-tetronate 4-phosphate decarboxylase [unclassified Streptomyces]MBD3007616.1 aldolase [Streptomyces sp. 5-10]